MEREKVVTTAEKVKALAIGFIGICIISNGATYFEEQAMYHVPRILLPVFNVFGNVGLAIGMVILGLVALIYGFIKWAQFSRNKMLYPIIAVPVLILGIFLSFYVGLFKDRDERNGLTREESRNAQIDEIRNMEKPEFKNEVVEKFLSDFDVIFKQFEENVKAGDEQGKQDSEAAYLTWIGSSVQAFAELGNEDKGKLSAYMAQLAFKWNDVREKGE